MKYLVRVVWCYTCTGKIQSTLKETERRSIAESFFDAYCKLMNTSPALSLKRVSLYEDGYEIERRINENGSQIRN